MQFILTPLHIIFYIFAAIAVGAAIIVITTRNTVYSVLALVLTFFATAAIWMLLHAEFLSLLLVLVYVGAVMTLFLFVVMMINLDKEKKHSGFVRYLPFGVIIVLVMVGLLIVTLKLPSFSSANANELVASANYNNIQRIGILLYTDYVYPVEIAGVVLLIAIIAAIALAHHAPRRRKVQNPSAQIAVDPRQRVRLISMPPTLDSINRAEEEN